VTGTNAGAGTVTMNMQATSSNTGVTFTFAQDTYALPAEAQIRHCHCCPISAKRSFGGDTDGTAAFGTIGRAAASNAFSPRSALIEVFGVCGHCAKTINSAAQA
jgi:hypothetical protein